MGKNDNRIRCPQCDGFLTKLGKSSYSTLYLLGLVETDYECYNKRCMLNKLGIIVK